jgi:hypothetical protein
MGRGRFPSANSYAPEGALPRLSRKCPDVPYRPASELIPKVRPRVTLFVPEGMKTPDMLVRVSVAGTTVWWMGDLFTNTAADDQNWVLRFIAPLAGSGMGYRRNSKPGLLSSATARPGCIPSSMPSMQIRRPSWCRRMEALFWKTPRAGLDTS